MCIRDSLTTRDDFSKCLAVHVRHGDKPSIAQAEKNKTAFVGAAHQLLTPLGLTKVQFMTDDAKVDAVFKAMPKVDPEVSVATVPASAGRRVDDAVEEDIALQLLTSAMLMGQCSTLLGSMVSVLAVRCRGGEGAITRA